MDMRSPDRPLEHGPEGFQRVYVSIAIGPLLPAMLDRPVIVPERREDAVRGPFVGANCGPGLDALKDRRNEAFAGSVRNNLGEQFAIAFKDAHDDGFSLGAAPGEAVFLTPALSADIGFVNFDMIGKGRIAVNRAHVFADQVGHAERRGVRNAKLALQFLGRNAVARRGKQVHGIKPLLQRCMRAIERRPDHRVNVMATPGAGIGRHLLEAGKTAILAALGAIKGFAVAQLHKVVEASVVIGELLHEINDGRMFGHFSLHSIKRVYH